MSKEKNENEVIWITSDIEEWDAPDVELLKYKNKEEKCYIRDVDVFDKEVEYYQVGDYILENSNMIQIKRAKLWKIIKIFEPDDEHLDNKKCRRMLISECWKKIELESLSLFALKNNIDSILKILFR